MWISLAVVTLRLGTGSWYSTPHHHWWPVTLITVAFREPSEPIARPVETLAKRRTNRVRTVTPTAPATTRLRRRRDSAGIGPGSPLSCGRRVTAAPRATITSTKTPEQTQNISHQRSWMWAAWTPWEWRAEWAPIQVGRKAAAQESAVPSRRPALRSRKFSR